jgi:hypothetical protein
MSEASEEILEDALNSDVHEVHKVAMQIMTERERTGIVATYDDNAHKGEAFDRSLLLGRLN